jgi:serine/threonine protein kinase
VVQDRSALSGDLADVPVPELIRRVTQGDASGVVRVRTPSGIARLWFADRTLVDATLGRSRMEAAVKRLATVDSGRFEITYEPVTRRRAIETPVEELLARLERARRRRRPTMNWRPTAGGRARTATRDEPTEFPSRAQPNGPPPPPPPRGAKDRSSGASKASPSRTAPTVLGRYEVLLRIARGGMGTVYLSRVTAPGGFQRLFAVKVLRDPLSRNPEHVEMLLREAQFASRLHHPNVVGIVDMGQVAGQHYLVMEYVEGCTLADLLRAHPRARPPRLIVPIMLDALCGLHAAHALTDDEGAPLDLVHCDVSPQNLLVASNGVCRITDFGIARAARLLEHEQTGFTRGKPSYLSPEQALGDRVDHRSDLFSAGVVLWNALTGVQLFAGDTPDAILQQVVEQPIPCPSTVGLRPPSCFDSVILRALERDPSRRPQSAEELLIELRRVAITRDHLAPPSEVASWVTLTFGRHLELRRRAAGLSKHPELDGSRRASADTASPRRARTTPNAQAQPETQAHESGTQIIGLERTRRRRETARALHRLTILGLAALTATTLVVIGIVQPDWLRGGIIDDYGDFVVRERRPVTADEDETGTGGVGLDEMEADDDTGFFLETDTGAATTDLNIELWFETDTDGVGSQDLGSTDATDATDASAVPSVTSGSGDRTRLRPD